MEEWGGALVDATQHRRWFLHVFESGLSGFGAFLVRGGGREKQFFEDWLARATVNACHGIVLACDAGAEKLNVDILQALIARSKEEVLLLDQILQALQEIILVLDGNLPRGRRALNLRHHLLRVVDGIVGRAFERFIRLNYLALRLTCF